VFTVTLSAPGAGPGPGPGSEQVTLKETGSVSPGDTATERGFSPSTTQFAARPVSPIV